MKRIKITIKIGMNMKCLNDNLLQLWIKNNGNNYSQILKWEQTINAKPIVADNIHRWAPCAYGNQQNEFWFWLECLWWIIVQPTTTTNGTPVIF